MNTKLISILILVGLAVLFIIQNVAIVEIQFIVWSLRLPRSLMMFLMLVLGILIGWFAHGHAMHRKRTNTK